MSEENKEQKTSKSAQWFGWVKNLIAAVVGAIISCAATIGIIGKSDADLAKEKMDSWLDKSETVYVQVVNVTDAVSEVKQLISDKKYLEALAKLEVIGTSTKESISAIKDLKEEIQEAIKTVKEQSGAIKENVQGKVDEIKEAVQGIKDATGNKPSDEPDLIKDESRVME